MNAAIIIPPYNDFYATRHRASHLGAKIVETICTNEGFCTSFHDLSSGPPAKIALPDTLDHLAPYIDKKEYGPLAFFTSYYRFGSPLLERVRLIAEHAPDLCLISCFAFCYADQTIELARTIRKLMPNAEIVLGGGGPSVYPDYFLRHSFVDSVLAGEAENTLKPFLDQWRQQRIYSDPNDTPFRKSGLAVPSVNSDLVFPLPPMFAARVVSSSKNSVTLSTTLSRGCPRGCRFCSNHLVHTKNFRRVPVNEIRSGIALIASTIDIGDRRLLVNFEDDNLLIDLPHTLEVFDLWRSAFKDVRFLAENGIDYSLLSSKCVNELVDAGLEKFNLSIGTINEQLATQEQRSFNAQQYESVLKAASGRGIDVVTYFICGLQGDSVENIAATLNYLYTQPTLAGISLFYPVPGLSGFMDPGLFDNCTSNLCAGSSAYPWTNTLSTKSMLTAFRLSRLINLAKKKNRSDIEEALLIQCFNNNQLYTLHRSGGTKKDTIVAVEQVDKELMRLFFLGA